MMAWKNDEYYVMAWKNDEYYVAYCYSCSKKTEHDRCTGRCVICDMRRR
jgi:hypothetical protein